MGEHGPGGKGGTPSEKWERYLESLEQPLISQAKFPGRSADMSKVTGANQEVTGDGSL